LVAKRELLVVGFGVVRSLQNEDSSTCPNLDPQSNSAIAERNRPVNFVNVTKPVMALLFFVAVVE
jgi:hypothetical protein